MNDYKPRPRDEAWKRLIEAHNDVAWYAEYGARASLEHFLAYRSARSAGLSLGERPVAIFRNGVCVAQWRQLS